VSALKKLKIQDLQSKEKAMISMSNEIKRIHKELNRLGIDTDFDPYSGIMAESVEDPSLVKIYDDYVSAIYTAGDVADLLEECEELDLDDFWSAIAPFEEFEVEE
jgi:hypothetical protein